MSHTPHSTKNSLSSRRNSRVVSSGPLGFVEHCVVPHAPSNNGFFISPSTVSTVHHHHHGTPKHEKPQQQSFTTPQNHTHKFACTRDTFLENTIIDTQNKIISSDTSTPNAELNEESSMEVLNNHTPLSSEDQYLQHYHHDSPAPAKPFSEKRYSKTSSSISSMKKYVISGGEIMNYTSPRNASTRNSLTKRKQNIMTEFHSLPSTLALVPITNSTTFFMKLHCSFCGGKNCKYENYLKTPPNETQLKEMHKSSNSNLLTTPRRRRKFWAIEGLNSHYVLDNIIASQRPSSRLVQKYHIIDQFKKHNIIAVVNLQERGEHPYCGDGILEKTGFSYDPEDDFMKHKSRYFILILLIFVLGVSIVVSYYNFAFPDMSIPNFDEMIAIVKAMKMDSEKGKVMVHCHAGLGRTGLVICCYLLYTKHFFSSKKAIDFVRSKRPGSIQTKSQVKFVYDFFAYLTENRTIFVCKSLKSAMEKQRVIGKLQSY